jgi:hypothetical protein
VCGGQVAAADARSVRRTGLSQVHVRMVMIRYSIPAVCILSAGACQAALSPQRITIDPLQVPGCYSVQWSPKIPDWGPGYSPVGPNLRFGQADSRYSGNPKEPGGPVTLGFWPVDSIPVLWEREEWAGWNIVGDSLRFGSPGLNQAIWMYVGPRKNGFRGAWHHFQDLQTPDSGTVELRRTNCDGT